MRRDRQSFSISGTHIDLQPRVRASKPRSIICVPQAWDELSIFLLLYVSFFFFMDKEITIIKERKTPIHQLPASTSGEMAERPTTQTTQNRRTRRKINCPRTTKNSAPPNPFCKTMSHHVKLCGHMDYFKRFKTSSSCLNIIDCRMNETSKHKLTKDCLWQNLTQRELTLLPPL